MNDIERYNWWNSEMDEYLNKIKPEVNNEQIDNPPDEVTKGEIFCELVKK